MSACIFILVTGPHGARLRAFLTAAFVLCALLSWCGFLVLAAKTNRRVLKAGISACAVVIFNVLSAAFVAYVSKLEWKLNGVGTDIIYGNTSGMQMQGLDHDTWFHVLLATFLPSVLLLLLLAVGWSRLPNKSQ